MLLVLRVADSAETRQREERFIAELELVLDRVEVVSVEPDDQEFATRSLGEQISMVRPLIEDHPAIAATWLDQNSPDLLLLHMVAVSSGRALARLVESPPVEGIEEDLAISARELLGTAFLFHDLPAQEPGLGEVVGELKGRIADGADGASEARGWSLGLAPTVRGGLYGHSGPSVDVGGAALAELGLAGGFHGRLNLSLTRGYLDGGTEPRLESWHTGLSIGAAYLWEVEPVSLGPLVEFGALWHLLIAELAEDDQLFSRFAYVLSIGLELRLEASERLDLFVVGAVHSTPARMRYRTESEDDVVLITPYLSWTVGLGLAFASR